MQPFDGQAFVHVGQRDDDADAACAGFLQHHFGIEAFGGDLGVCGGGGDVAEPGGIDLAVLILEQIGSTGADGGDVGLLAVGDQTDSDGFDDHVGTLPDSAMESSGFDNYMAQADAGPALARAERSHSRTLSTMYSPGGATDVAGIAQGERWHRVDTGGQLRAAIFGISDGLLSNLSLIIGVAGANPEGRFIVLTGIAGLLAGAFSMGAGEYISVTSQRELFERQIALEKEELESDPEQERKELALIYRAKGLPIDEAEALSKRIIADSGVALETLAREELGLNPEGLGSPWGVAIASFLAFAAGAIIPVIPWFFGSTTPFFIASVVLGALAMFAVGASVSLFTGRNFVFAGMRQLTIGMGAALITFSIGKLIGAQTG